MLNLYLAILSKNSEKNIAITRFYFIIQWRKQASIRSLLYKDTENVA